MPEFSASILLEHGAIYTPHKYPQHVLGTRGYTRDGRAFRYTLNGETAMSPGQLVQAEALDANMVAQEIADSTDWAVPSTSCEYIYLSTDTSIATADFFKDGYFMVTAGGTAYGGQSLQIKSHTGFAGEAGPQGCPKITFNSESKLDYALTTAYTVSIIKNPYKRVIAALTADAAITAPAMGVCPSTVPANYYFWLQTWGMSCVWCSGTLDAGRSVFYDSTTGCSNSGAVKTPTTQSFPGGKTPVGVAQFIGVDGSCAGVMLNIAP